MYLAEFKYVKKDKQTKKGILNRKELKILSVIVTLFEIDLILLWFKDQIKLTFEIIFMEGY